MCKAQTNAPRIGERGGATLKFLIVLAILGAIAYAGYQYIPVAYEAYTFKDYMQVTVDKAAALGQPAETVKANLKASEAEYGVPPDAVISANQRDGRLEARVQFARAVVFPGYTYQYNFDHTVSSTSLFSAK